MNRFSRIRHRALVTLAGAATLATTLTFPAHAGPEKPKPFTLTETTIDGIHSALQSHRLTCTQLVDSYLRRIKAYDQAGPRINSYITVSDKALKRAAALDKAFARNGFTGQLHCVPVILKDNIDTADMPTTGGSKTLAGTYPTSNAAVTQRLLDAGAVVLGKGNLDEWAHGGSPGGGYSSMGGQTLNPYDLTRAPAGSSAGPGAAVAANLAAVGMGTDTLGSLRGPAAANDLVSIKPTMGLVSGTGIIPFSLTFDVAGPLTRTVSDSAAMLGVLTGVDAKDPRTKAGKGHGSTDYTQFLDADKLSGARIGIVDNFSGGNTEIDAATQRAVDTMRARGATVVTVHMPDSLLSSAGSVYASISDLEFKHQLADYLATRKKNVPVKTLADVIAQSSRPGFPISPAVLPRLKQAESQGPLTDPEYQQALATGPASFRKGIDSVLTENRLDALVFPTASCPPGAYPGSPATNNCQSVPGSSALASLSGYPSTMVPNGFTANRLPISLAFLGTAFSEPELIGLSYSFEQATNLRRPPASAPPLGSRAR
ncbi:amidase family protein [Streptomyces sp. NPDC000880]